MPGESGATAAAGGSKLADQEAKKTGVNRPTDSRLKQQKLKAWQPILTAGTVLPVFFFVGFVFIPIGAALLVASNGIFEYSYDYTDCLSSNAENSTPCKDIIKNVPDTDCRCQHTFTVDKTVTDNVYVYYGLSNFYQNHRRYVKSRDDKQLLGDLTSTATECEPFRFANDSQKTPIAPCGAIANSMFNDSFVLTMQTTAYSDSDSNPITVPFDFSGIAWPSDRNSKFKNPTDINEFEKYAKPPNWRVSIDKLSSDVHETGFKNESFIVWMRISALPTFRKLYSKIKQEGTFSELRPGNYTMHIVYNYPVDMFDGRKRFIISTTSWAGGKNAFLGVAYIIVGCLCVLTGTVFFFIHLKYGKSLSEMANVAR